MLYKRLHHGMGMCAFVCSFPVNWVDTDALGIVHFSNYLRYFEKAEEEFYRGLGNRDPSAKQKNVAFPRVEVHCNYRNPCSFGDVVELTLTLKEMKVKSVTIDFAVFNRSSSKKAAEGYVTLVAVDTEKWVSIPIPEYYREVFSSLE